MKSKTTTLGPFVRLGRGLEYTLVIQRGKGRNPYVSDSKYRNIL